MDVNAFQINLYSTEKKSPYYSASAAGTVRYNNTANLPHIISVGKLPLFPV